MLAQRRALLQVEKSVLRDLDAQGEISEDIRRELTAAVDLRLHTLDRDQAAEPTLSHNVPPLAPAPLW